LGHVVPIFILFYNFNNAGIINNKIFEKYVKDKKIFAFSKTKRYKKGIDGGKCRENLKKCANPNYSPLHCTFQYKNAPLWRK
jgi:hypothetical protein